MAAMAAAMAATTAMARHPPRSRSTWSLKRSRCRHLGRKGQAPSRSVHPDSDKTRIPSASVLNTFGVIGSGDFRAGAWTPRTCPADGTASAISASPWSGRSPSVAARVAGGGLGGGIRTAKSTGNHCGGHATPRTGSCVFELRGKVAAGLGVSGKVALGVVAPRRAAPSYSNVLVSKGTSGVTAWCPTR
eukprot:scaffold42520_cov53-Phaeocystis_antarctica.AAC.1